VLYKHKVLVQIELYSGPKVLIVVVQKTNLCFAANVSVSVNSGIIAQPIMQCVR